MGRKLSEAGDHAAVIADHPVWNAELGETEPLEMHLCDGAVVLCLPVRLPKFRLVLAGFNWLSWSLFLLHSSLRMILVEGGGLCNWRKLRLAIAWRGKSSLIVPAQ